MSTILISINILLLMAISARTEDLKKFSFVAKHPFGQMNFTKTENFIELLKGDFYIDKTMLISLVVKFVKYKVIAIHIPSKWGKSVNLDMIRTFLEIQVDQEGRRKAIESTPSYKLFHNGEIVDGNGKIERLKRPLLISSHKQILNRYLGRYPIIYLNFENLVASSYDGLIRQIGKRIKNAYSDHPYIEKVIRSKLENTSSLELKKQSSRRLRTYLRMVKKKLTQENDIMSGIEVLSEILHWIHGSRRVYVLVDNYDGILLSVLSNSAISDDDATQVLNFFASLLSIFQTNEYQKKAIFMGTFPILETIRDLRSIKEYKALNNVLMPFYSLSLDDVNLLFERLKVPSFLRTKALNWYKGYRWGKDLTDRIFSMSSIFKFISTGRLDYCKIRNSVIDSILDKIIDSLTIRWFLLVRLHGQVWRMLPKIQKGMSSTNFLDMKSYLIGTKTEDEIFICFPFEPFLRSMGNLAVKSIQDRDSISDSFMIYITVSSNEARIELAEKLINYYCTKYNILSDVIEQGVQNMAMCLNESDKDCLGFSSFIQRVSQNVPLINEMIEMNKVRGVNPTIFMSTVVHYLGLKLSLDYDDFVIESVDHEEDEAEEHIGWRRVVIFSEQRVNIIEVQVCSSALFIKDAAKRDYNKNPKYPTFKEINFMGVNIFANGSVEIRSELSTGLSLSLAKS